MSRWFRFYDEALNDPKVQRLNGDAFKAWVNLLCLASKNDGVLPTLPDIAFALRQDEAQTSDMLNHFYQLGLFDEVEIADAPMTYEPHNWKTRQFKSDVTDPTAPERQRAYRKRNANRNGDRNATVTVTPTRTDTESETEQITEANASGAVAPDPRARLFKDGLAKLASLTGKGPDACRSFVGKCLKASGDDAQVVLGLIEDAERNRVVDAGAWIMARITGPPTGKPLTEFQQRQTTTREIADELRNARLRIGSSGTPDQFLPDDQRGESSGVRGRHGATVLALPGASGGRGDRSG